MKKLILFTSLMAMALIFSGCTNNNLHFLGWVHPNSLHKAVIHGRMIPI